MLVLNTSKGEINFKLDLITDMNLRETQEKKQKEKANAIPSTDSAKYVSYYWHAKETPPNVRRRVPRQLTPIKTESKQVNLNKID